MHSDNSAATPTPVTDGKRVCAIFTNGDLACFGFDGERVWAMSLGNPDNLYGHASSLAMYQNLLLVLFDQGTAEDGLSQLVALEAPTGRTVWRTKRPVPNSWASPIIIDTGTREEIITCGAPWVIAYDPSSGEELWRAECLGGDVAPSPVYANGLVLATTPYELLAAIRPGGQGDVSQSHIAWTADYNLPDISSPLSTGKLVFLLTTEGVLTCYDAEDGKMIWEKDFATVFRSSPTLVGDQVYLMNEEGVMFIVAASRKYEELGRAELAEDSNCSPAFLDGRIYIRGTRNLYCMGKDQK
jgi:outer membrane protein assembly factor BamB